MRKFQEWARLREGNPVVPEMQPGGQTPLAHATGAAGAPVEDESVLSGNLENHFNKLMADLDKLQKINKAKAMQIVNAIMQKMQELGVQKNVAQNAVRSNW